MELPNMREKVKEYITELDSEIKRCKKILEEDPYMEVSSNGKYRYPAIMSRINTLIEVKNDLKNRLKELI